jgi:hypothetical protein
MKRSLVSYKEPKIQDAYKKKKQKKATNPSDLAATSPDPTDPGWPRRGGA